MKKILIIMSIVAFAISISGFSFAAELDGQVTKVRGKIVTIKITEGKASKLKPGTEVTIESDDSAPTKSGKKKGRLMGC
ncbi:MAG: hypothetical protein QM483_12280 [Desulfuromusa sp.]